MKVVFYKAWVAGNILDKLVTVWTMGPYSHCELLFSDNICFSSSWRDKGVRFKKINLLPDRWIAVEIPTTKEQEKNIRAWCKEREDKGEVYDWWGIANFVLPFIKQKDDDWFCSEVCIAALKEFGIVGYPNETSPNKFFRKLKKDGYKQI